MSGLQESVGFAMDGWRRTGRWLEGRDVFSRECVDKVTVIKRRAYALPTFDGLRERVLVACG
jgi:hypothetical protein